jgi:hypothetical protein
MTSQEIKQRFSSPAFSEVAEILEMIQRTPQQRSQYELRLKAHRDERARLQFAVEQATLEGEARGEARGKAAGKLIGQIETLSGLLGEQAVPLDDLSVDELVSLADNLQRQLLKRGLS